MTRDKANGITNKIFLWIEEYLSAILLSIHPQNMISQSDPQENPDIKQQVDIKEGFFTMDIRERTTMLTDTDTKPYFVDGVVKGKKFSKNVQKDSQPAENSILKKDVAEGYIPLMDQNNFQGALEIYYDISKQKQDLDRPVSKALVVIYSLTLVFLAAVGIVLYKASIQMLHGKRRAF